MGRIEMEQEICIDCGQPLIIDKNWTIGQVVKSIYICKDCNSARRARYRVRAKVCIDCGTKLPEKTNLRRCVNCVMREFRKR